MDLWVVAAAAGAGYLAKHWQNIFREKESAFDFFVGSSFLDEPQSPSLIEILRERTNPLKELPRNVSDIGKGDLSGELFGETSRRGREATCSSALNHGREVGVHDEGSVPSQYFEWNRGDFVLDVDMGNIPEDTAWKMGGSLASRRSRNTKRSRRLHLPFVKPRTSLDSCLMAQMHKERTELEEYLLTPLSSPCTTALRPFLVSDGKRLISKTRGEFRSGIYKEVHLKSNNEVAGAPRLPQVSTVDYSKQKFSIKNRMERSHFSSKLMQVDSRAGISSGQALFCLGISIGILSTIIANKVELEKLKESLKQSEHLVEDLQDELEMKDSLTVKELVNDDDSQDTHGILSGTENLDVFSNQADMNVLVQFDDEELVCLKKNDLMSNIEAELEAELERLELSMKGSTLLGELNQEFDQDMIADLVSGELQADAVHRRSSSETTLNRSSRSSPTPHSTKDGVSPRELSLRLHEVIQSRLEKRVMELEAELAISQNHIERLISERANYWRDVPDSGPSSSRCSPRVVETHGPRGTAPAPLIMNLSGDALDAYNEAFEELDKLKQTEDRETVIQSDGLSRFSEGSKAWLAGKQEEAIPISITGIPSSEDSPNDNYDSDDDDNDDDMLLIKQIVEKARQGSPAIMRAQKAMVSLNRDH